jgi:hypothetical protein
MIGTVVATILLLGSPDAAGQESGETLERRALGSYLAELLRGQPGRPSEVDRFSELPFPCFMDVVRSYTEAGATLEPASHRAYQALLERMSRSALAPWTMIRLYSEDFADFLTRPLAGNAPAKALFLRLLESGIDPQAYDLAVRLMPDASLRHLASNPASGRDGLLRAWNRRLLRAPEKRPIRDLDVTLDLIRSAFSLTAGPQEIEERLRFLASWPSQRAPYLKALDDCLQSESPAIVLAALAVQERVPALLGRNEALVARFRSNPDILVRALRNFVFERDQDYSATLRSLWMSLPVEDARPRYACLLAMATHPRGNDTIALNIVLQDPLQMSEASLVLAHGDPDNARKAVRHVLTRAHQGEEPALRLALKLGMRDFEPEALRIALDPQKDQILRQRALEYLGGSEGTTRRKLLPLLFSRNDDLRLSAVQMFASKQGLAPSDLEEVGPLLSRVALEDASPGHREEAINVLGRWKHPGAEKLFRKLLRDTKGIAPGSEEYYWSHRFRVEALLGLVRLDDPAAREELLEIHRRGGPTERMNVLLAFRELGEAPEIAFEDLKALEPKLVSTAAHLIARYGDAEARTKLRSFFDQAPLWKEFLDSGIDDSRILRAGGLR